MSIFSRGHVYIDVNSAGVRDRESVSPWKTVVGMRLWCNLVNVYTNPSKRLHEYGGQLRNAQSHDNSIVASNIQQLPLGLS